MFGKGARKHELVALLGTARATGPQSHHLIHPHVDIFQADANSDDSDRCYS